MSCGGRAGRPIDLHRTFGEVVIWDKGVLRHAGKVKLTRPGHEGFGKTLEPTDEVVIEATGNRMVVAWVLSLFTARAIIANPLQVKAVAHAHVRTDKIDAATLASLHRAGFLIAGLATVQGDARYAQYSPLQRDRASIRGLSKPDCHSASTGLLPRLPEALEAPEQPEQRSSFSSIRIEPEPDPQQGMLDVVSRSKAQRATGLSNPRHAAISLEAWFSGQRPNGHAPIGADLA